MKLRPIRPVLVLATLLTGAVALARTQASPSFTVPSGAPNTAMTSEPFGRGPGRFQQIISGSAITLGPANLNLIAFRAHGPAATAHLVDMELRIGMAARAPSVMSTAFADNISGPLLLILPRRNYNIPALPGAGGFVVRFPFNQPYAYPGMGNLVFDVIVHGNDNGNQPFFYDLSLAFSSQVSYVSTYTSPQAPSGVRNLNQGMLLLFEYDQATFTSFGLGCRGEDGYVPKIANVGFPRIGQPFQVHVTNITGSRNAWLFLGSSRTAWGPLPLPFDLTALGATGCNLYLDMTVMEPVLSMGGTGGTGYAWIPVTVPGFSAFIGVEVFYQWMIHAPGANPLQISFSDAAVSRIGS